jgi:hypothetical protein
MVIDISEWAFRSRLEGSILAPEDGPGNLLR